MSAAKPLKQPVSVLVVLHDGNGNILLIERADRAATPHRQIGGFRLWRVRRRHARPKPAQYQQAS